MRRPLSSCVRTQALASSITNTDVAALDGAIWTGWSASCGSSLHRQSAGQHDAALPRTDRTVTELGGGAYTGEGDRELLGEVATDRNGNYLFHFGRTLAQFLAEADVDLATGQDLELYRLLRI